MKKQLAAGVLVCLLLSACGGKPADTSPLGAAAGVEETECLLTVDGREIPAWRYLYWLAENCRQLEEDYDATGETLNWTAPLADGQTAETLVKEAALADTVLYAVVEQWGETYDCGLTQEEWETLPERAYNYLTAAEGQELTAVGQTYVKLYRLYRTEGGPLAPAAGEAEQFGEETGLLFAQRITVPAGENREEARQQAAAQFARINGAEDSAQAFEEILEETGGGEMAQEDWTPALRAAASVLAAGQISGLLETETGFCILRRLPIDPEALAEAHFDSLLRSAGEQASVIVSGELEGLSVKEFWQRLGQNPGES